MCSRLLVCLAFAALAPLAGGQTPLRPPAPLLAAPAETMSPGQATITLGAADRALEMGFSSLAADLYRKLLDPTLRAPVDRLQLQLSLASALLSAGEVAEAGRVLDDYAGVRTAAWQMRAE